MSKSPTSAKIHAGNRYRETAKVIGCLSINDRIARHLAAARQNGGQPFMAAQAVTCGTERELLQGLPVSG